MNAISSSPLRRSGLCLFGAVALALVAFASTSAAPVVNGTHYAEALPAACNNKTVCTLSTTTVANGMQLLVTRVNCVATVYTVSTTATPAFRDVVFGKDAGPTHMPATPAAYFVPTLFSHSAGTRLYGFNDQTSLVLAAGTRGRIYLDLYGSTSQLEFLDCTVFGDLTSALP